MMTLAAAAVAFLMAFAPLTAKAQTDGSVTNDAVDGKQPSVARLLGDVGEVADRLTENMADVQEALAKSVKSRDEGTKLLEQVKAAVESVHGSLAKESGIWTELTKAIQVWDDNRTAALEKAETNPAFDDIAKQWGARIEQAGSLREQILTQRAEAKALLDRILSDRELVLAYYDLEQADRALEALQMVSKELSVMNDSMQKIVDQVQMVAAPAVAQ